MRSIFGATSGKLRRRAPRFVPPPMARMVIGVGEAISVARRKSTAFSFTGPFGLAGRGKFFKGGIGARVDVRETVLEICGAVVPLVPGWSGFALSVGRCARFALARPA